MRRSGRRDEEIAHIPHLTSITWDAASQNHERELVVEVDMGTRYAHVYDEHQPPLKWDRVLKKLMIEFRHKFSYPGRRRDDHWSFNPILGYLAQVKKGEKMAHIQRRGGLAKGARAAVKQGSLEDISGRGRERFPILRNSR
jgi:hypothetical protein